MKAMTEDHAYLYIGSISEARRFNELDRWRESHRENIACKQAIEEAIRQGFDGMYLDHDCAKSVIEAYGYKRVGWVLASTLQQKRMTAGSAPGTRNGPKPPSFLRATGTMILRFRAIRLCWMAS